VSLHVVVGLPGTTEAAWAAVSLGMLHSAAMLSVAALTLAGVAPASVAAFAWPQVLHVTLWIGCPRE